MSIKHNQVEDISALSKLSNLVEFIAEDNKISDISPLMNLETLTCVKLKDNPVEDDKSYRELWNKINNYRESKGLELVDFEEVE